MKTRPVALVVATLAIAGSSAVFAQTTTTPTTPPTPTTPSTDPGGMKQPDRAGSAPMTNKAAQPAVAPTQPTTKKPAKPGVQSGKAASAPPGSDASGGSSTGAGATTK